MPKPRVFVTRQLPGNAHQLLTESAQLSVWPEPFPPPRQTVIAKAAESEGLLTLITDQVDRELLEAAPSLKVVSNMGVGYDNIDVAACTERGIPVGNTPGVLTDATADLAFALLLAMARRLFEASDFVHSGQWRTWDPNLLLGQDVGGATLGIAGFGKIGRAVARRARGFGMRVLFTSGHSADENEAAEQVDKETLLRESDFVSLHVPLNRATRHYIGIRELALMKPTAVLINTSRGGVVNHAELAAALRSGRPGGAALDVTDPEPIPMDDPLLQLPNVLVVPHIGSGTRQTRIRMAQLAVENLKAVLEGRRPRHCVNPEVFARSVGET
jgi:glyoxylate reductase